MNRVFRPFFLVEKNLGNGAETGATGLSHRSGSHPWLPYRPASNRVG